ncbi:replication protein A 70 kDa DNA-binding subunit C-like [Lotus japonicus]|uniref:replication protein A 70 kDa DNA-binding subunit C-like n=1 Tax=Lotus japonicus TaxID=34305 RepID=UPI0025885590|nr:replication protein A 70 kDa DNA-binding subunit C-like [Lotus japonicus]
MASLASNLNSVANLCNGRESWRIKVRVVRMWEMCPISEPGKPFAVQMVLIDAEGQRIEATIRKSLIKKLFGEIVEGNIYRITYFAVVPNLGVYKAARHEFKIIFNSRTKIVPEESNLIPLYGFAFMNSAEISDIMGESEHLIDVIGLVTAVSREKQYTKGANITRMIELQLTDHRGSVQCTFFGSYVDVITHHVRENGQAMPVVVIQFAKIKTFKGNVVIQNVMHATRIMWNHEIPEVVDFRNRCVHY